VLLLPTLCLGQASHHVPTRLTLFILSIYFSVITGSTIGFGDLSPHKPGVRLACCFLLPLFVAVLGEFLGRIAGTYMDRQNRKAERHFLNRTMTLNDLQMMDTNTDGMVQKDEFLAFMLVALQKVDKSDIDSLLELFDHLDVSKTGTVTKDDVLNGSWREHIQTSS
jgi:hypothetical protein